MPLLDHTVFFIMKYCKPYRSISVNIYGHLFSVKKKLLGVQREDSWH